MEVLEFTIESRKNDFRVPKLSPIDLLALQMQTDLDNFEKTKLLFKFALEHTEVKVGEKWFPVKTANKEIYFPTDLGEDYVALNEICAYFLENVMAKVFQKSSE